MKKKLEERKRINKKEKEIRWIDKETIYKI